MGILLALMINAHGISGTREIRPVTIWNIGCDTVTVMDSDGDLYARHAMDSGYVIGKTAMAVFDNCGTADKTDDRLLTVVVDMPVRQIATGF